MRNMLCPQHIYALLPRVSFNRGEYLGYPCLITLEHAHKMAAVVKQHSGNTVSLIASPALAQQFNERIIRHRQHCSAYVDHMEQHRIWQ